MSKLINLLTALLVALWVSCASYAQTERRALSIEELFALADDNNLSIRAAATAVDVAAQNAQTARNVRLPSVDVSLSVGYNGNGKIWDRDFSNPHTAPIPHLGNNFSIEASQVIFAGGAIGSGVKIARLQEQLAALDAERDRQQVRFLIVGNYLELCKLQNQLQVFDSNVARTQKMLENMRQRLAEGAALPGDVMRYELQLQNLDYSRIRLRNAISLTNNQLTVATGLPLEVVIVPDDRIIEAGAGPTLDHARPDAASALSVQMAEKAEQIALQGQTRSRAERLPQVALFAGDYLNGPVTIEIPALDKNFNWWAAGVSVKYNLGNLYKSNAGIRASRLAAKRAAEERAVAREQVGLAAEAADTHYREAFALLETREKSVELATQNHDVITRRYENGLALMADLLDADAQKLDAELQVIDTRINIVYNHYKLKYIAGTL
ncbi:hypothetical protein FACS1894159_07590 [Bacteroidia bacterium]|nr:hypothetical protein FACS1894159_07590 [Bacteroidia bacterium]